MARRKTKRVQVKKVYRAKLDTCFSCPFCNEDNSVECKLDRAKQTGTARCRTCNAGYQTVINYLSEPIDVFAEWVDAIDEQKKQRTLRRDLKSARELSPDRRHPRPINDGEEDHEHGERSAGPDEDTDEFKE